MKTIVSIFEKKWQVVLLSISIVLFLTISKDLLHSFIEDYNFYLSESLLFGTFWLLHIPFLVWGRNLLKQLNWFTKTLAALAISILHITVFSFLVFFISFLFYNHTFSFIDVFIDTLVDNGLSCLLIYTPFAFIYPKLKSKKLGKLKPLMKIKVDYKNSVQFISIEDILYIKSERPYTAIVTKERSYLHNNTLKDFLKSMPSDKFIQVHKSSIININHIDSYTSRKNGDYDVLMLNGDLLKVSRNFNKNFKKFSRSPG